MKERVMRPVYPDAKRLDLIEQIHGHAVADPYRWLEDDASPETIAWSRAQDALARPILDAQPGRTALRGRLRELVVGLVGLPILRGDRVFWFRREPDQDLAVLYVRDPDSRERVLLDANELSDDHTVTLDMVSPSHDGALLAYKLSQGGDEETTLYIRDVATGEIVDDPIDRTRAGSFAWMPDGRSYYYVRRLPADSVPAGEADYHRRVWYRRIGADRASDQLVFGEGRDKIEFYGVSVSRDGRWLIVSAAKGNARHNDLYIADLDGDGAFRTIVEGEIATTSGHVSEDDGRLYILTNLDAPRCRYVIADPTAPTPEHWRDLLAESGAVLISAFPARDSVVAVYSEHARSRVTIHDRETGAVLSEVALPGPGTVAGMTTQPHPAERDEIWFGYTDFVTPLRSYHYTISTGAMEVWASPPGENRLPDVEAKQIFYTSADGTTVPMFVVHKRDLELDGKRPTILHGYGGWAISQVPGFSSAAVAWVERGGVWAVASIRGGSEYGEAWHRDGMLDKKQNVFDDFIAAARWLIDNDYTSPQHLGIQGGSNGGILVGACLTQQPDLFASAVCSAPVLDLIRFPKMPGGQIAHGELGNPDVPEQFAYLYAYSPYHRVEPNTAYPATLFTIFESDARVAPWHARKMCAAMQDATSSDQSILFRREEQVGHAARSLTRSIELSVDTLTFHAEHLQLRFET